MIFTPSPKNMKYLTVDIHKLYQKPSCRPEQSLLAILYLCYWLHFYIQVIQLVLSKMNDIYFRRLPRFVSLISLILSFLLSQFSTISKIDEHILSHQFACHWKLWLALIREHTPVESYLYKSFIQLHYKLAIKYKKHWRKQTLSQIYRSCWPYNYSLSKQFTVYNLTRRNPKYLSLVCHQNCEIPAFSSLVFAVAAVS